ncbi:hypothetical protein C7974DRAFT_98048 [Boeremia exigua]|uniref:uncharacterized protein n=1 Tax=Boeremia exigua TaxID=749465 RepID=UPI001E8DCABD|nr:uncharacterized protein C7974DRAFT_98048 [Boeremia exigua]KAH6642253.1 hypothetical protein C7974DRAFT_98048 [Boeremia exigua]
MQQVSASGARAEKSWLLGPQIVLLTLQWLRAIEVQLRRSSSARQTAHQLIRCSALRAARVAAICCLALRSPIYIARASSEAFELQRSWLRLITELRSSHKEAAGSIAAGGVHVGHWCGVPTAGQIVERIPCIT